jgi:hypothetical protein
MAGAMRYMSIELHSDNEIRVATLAMPENLKVARYPNFAGPPPGGTGGVGTIAFRIALRRSLRASLPFRWRLSRDLSPLSSRHFRE